MASAGRDESVRVMILEGGLDIGACDELQRALREFVEQASRVTVDVSAVEFCDAAFLQLICSAAKTARAAGKQFEFVALSPAVANTAAALGLPIRELTAQNDNSGAQCVMKAPGENGGVGCAQ